MSPTYAHEVTSDPELGFGLEGVLRDKGENFVGILNGADYDEWDPAHDREIAADLHARRNPTANANARAHCATRSACRTARTGRSSGW